MLEVGSLAPDFSLPDENGEIHKLSDYRGQKVILYFYPKDNTAGCTRQACGFKDRYPLIQEKGAVVLGISKILPEHIRILRPNMIYPLLCCQILNTR